MKKIQHILLAAGLLAASSATAAINIDTVFVDGAGQRQRHDHRLRRGLLQLLYRHLRGNKQPVCGVFE